MEYVEFGKTGRKVSRIGFGGAVAGLKNYLHEYDPASDESRKGVIEAITKALELGVTYFDTAPGYGNGQSETMFGEALAGVNPKEIFLATKLHYGDRDHVFRSVEESLKRLKRDYVDLIQIHGSSYTQEETDFILQENGTL
ncbi:MAG TPA: aldo/keto reductase, partial [Clostridia bacterium]